MYCFRAGEEVGFSSCNPIIVQRRQRGPERERNVLRITQLFTKHLSKGWIAIISHSLHKQGKYYHVHLKGTEAKQGGYVSWLHGQWGLNPGLWFLTPRSFFYSPSYQCHSHKTSPGQPFVNLFWTLCTLPEKKFTKWVTQLALNSGPEFLIHQGESWLRLLKTVFGP